MRTNPCRSILLLGALLTASCARFATPGPKLEIAVAPLTLPGVGQVCYDLRTSNGPDGTGSVVWAVGDPSVDGDADALCSGTFGNGTGGDITFIGACDASPAALGDAGRTNSVTLWVDALRGTDGLPIAEDGAEGWQDPCPSGCTLNTTCLENADTRVDFNLTILRQANQGFFDIGVNFDDIFCSAKVDCTNEAGDPIDLLFRPGTGTRDTTIVSALACTAGPGTDTRTVLYRNPLAITCAGSSVSLPATTDKGNIYGAANPDPNLTDAVWQYAVYAGQESLSCGGSSCNKLYWNIAVGLDETVDDCVLTTRMTAAKSGTMVSLSTPTGTTYPYIEVEVPLTNATGLSCGRHPLNGPDGRVRTRYTPITNPVTFTTKLSTLVDECADGVDNCSENAICADTPSAFTCTCKAGFTGNGVTCTDIDECGLGTDDCAAVATCTNTAGSFTCACPAGFTGDGRTCSCGPGLADCNGVAADTCEVTLATHHDHCGACNSPCANDEICSAGACIKPCSASPTAIAYTGATANVTVPSGCNTAEVKVWGAGGGGGGNSRPGEATGGAGGFVYAKLAVTSGATLTAVVGGGGGPANVVDGAGGAGGFGGGGKGGAGAGSFLQGGGGGGYSGLFSGAVSAANALVIAGGGGGSGHADFTRGGPGGGGNGVAATNSGVCYPVIGAGGGTQIAGGQPTTILVSTSQYNQGGAGTSLTGGAGGAPYLQWGGGGGGGGYFGGAGGNGDNGWNTCNWGGNGASGSSGGGGSGYVNAGLATDVLQLAGTQATQPAFNMDTDYVAGVGVGGIFGAHSGGPGRITIRWAYRHVIPSTSVATDADAETFITAAGLTNATHLAAVRRLVQDLKQAGLWTRMLAIYPMVGGTEASHKFNLKDPRDLDAAYRLLFLGGGWVHAATGAKPNGTSSYADTRMNPSSALTAFDTHLAYYSRTATRVNGAGDIGSYSGSGGNILLLLLPRQDFRGGSFMYEQFTATNTAVSPRTLLDASGFWMGNRTSNIATTHRLWLNGAAIAAATTSAGTMPSANIWIGALPNGGSAPYYSAKEIAFASIGAGLSEAEAAAYYIAVQRFNTALGRQVGDAVN